MAQNLAQYVAEQIKRGHSIDSVRQYLLKYGYKPADVESAIREAHGHHQITHVIHFSKNTVIALAILFVGIIGVFFAIKLISSPGGGTGVQQKLLDLKVNELSTSPKPGDDFSYNVEISNMGASGRYDVSLDSKIVDGAGMKLMKKQRQLLLRQNIPEPIRYESLLTLQLEVII